MYTNSAFKWHLQMGLVALLLLCYVPLTHAQTSILNLSADDLNGDGTQNTGDIGSATNSTWVDIEGNDNATLTNFTLPGNGSSGWDGDGTVSDPYRLEFDGTNDYIVTTQANDTMAALSVWFRVDSFGGAQSDIIRTVNNNYTIVRFGTTPGSLRVRYYNFFVELSYQEGQWHHLLMTSDGTTEYYYLDGVEVATQQRPQRTADSFRIGNYDSTFDGAIGQFQIFSDYVTPTQARSIYETSRTRFQDDPLNPRIDRIVPAVGSSSTTTSVTLYGWNFNGTTAVTVGGSPATSITVTSTGSVTATFPSGAVGSSDVVLTTSVGNTTRTNAFRYTTAPTDNLSFWLDAANTDAVGTRGVGTTGSGWQSLVGGNNARFININHASGGTKGWAGVGTTSDPYRLELEGTTDYVRTSEPDTNMATIALWLRIDSHGDTLDHIFQTINDSYTRLRFGTTPGSLQVMYNSLLVDFAYQTGEWYHLVMTCDGSTAYYYLNGVEFATQSRSVRGNDAFIFGNYNHEYNFDGAIAQFQVYSDYLTPTETYQLYEVSRTRFTADPTTPRINRIVPAVGSTTATTGIEIYGWNLSSPSSATVGGAAATSLTEATVGKVTATTPTGTAGLRTLSLISGAGTAINHNSFLYTEAPVDNLLMWFDAANIDMAGMRGDGANADSWLSLDGKQRAVLHNFTLPGDGSSGWDGDGTVGDPYRIEFDGTDDYIRTGEPSTNIATVTLWFRIDTAGDFADQIFRSIDEKTRLRFHSSQSGKLQGLYNNQTIDFSYSIGQWYHYVMTCDGSTVRHYLNGSQIATQSRPVRDADSFLIGNYNHEFNFDGAIAQFQVYSDYLSASEVTDLYNHGITPSLQADSPAIISPKPSANHTLTLLDGTDVTTVAQRGMKVVRVKEDGELIADVPVNFNNGNCDWSNVVATNAANGRRVVVQFDGNHCHTGTHTIYSLKEDTTAFRVCPVAANLSDVHESCYSNAVVNTTDSVELMGKDVDISVVNIDGNDYWKAAGLLSSGGQGEGGSGSSNDVPDLRSWSLVLLLLACGAVVHHVYRRELFC